ncbi:TPA: hypothetical protein SMI77_004887 [Serratia marcescens]|nr:hypothetical protein [Serratia marcescens]
MTPTTERQQFEQWWETAMHNGYPPRFGWEHWRDGDGYRDDDGEFQGLWQAWQASRGFLANREAQPVSGECDQDVYANGTSACLVDIPKETAEVICRGISQATGCKVDWHYIGGRVHIKAIAPPAPAVPESIITAPIEAMLYSPAASYVLGWNACRAAMLAAAPEGGNG